MTCAFMMEAVFLTSDFFTPVDRSGKFTAGKLLSAFSDLGLLLIDCVGETYSAGGLHVMKLLCRSAWDGGATCKSGEGKLL